MLKNISELSNDELLIALIDSCEHLIKIIKGNKISRIETVLLQGYQHLNEEARKRYPNRGEQPYKF